MDSNRFMKLLKGESMASSVVKFIEENYHDLLCFAVRLMGNWADGEDVMQTVVTKICSSQDELEDIVHCKSYLMVCIRNAALNHRRTQARQRVVDGSYEKLKDSFTDPTTEEAFEFVEWIITLERHLKCYDEQLRKAFIAYYIEQEPLEQVAASLGLTKRQTIKKFEGMRLYLKNYHKRMFTQLSILLSM